ncbi:hypothetical protein [Chryseobacterium profundimaris]|uniref:Uncharacterized protein n=1 Tax=Chryseobacterium profundimaris TaxID=1387275 RepID=A0ABY1NG74_9FLAO|nr:hypothetical protein [Chryseobacterium profundimaris]SMP08955.1 hypothetical protein SAMN06264346_10212 [Chryseobacterium profundimaris]
MEQQPYMSPEQKEEAEKHRIKHKNNHDRFFEAKNIFEQLHPETRLKIVKQDKVLYRVLDNSAPPDIGSLDHNPPLYTRQRIETELQKLDEFIFNYDPAYLEIKTKEDFNSLNEESKQDFKEHFPGEFNVIEKI